MPLETVEENLKALIRVQEADHSADEMAKARQAALDAIDLDEARLKACQQRLEDGRKALLEVQKQQKAMEIEVASLDTKVSKYQTQLFEVKSNKDYDALKAEIENAKAEKARIEDRILEGLFRQDEQKKALEALARQVEEDRKKAAADRVAHQARVAECERLKAEKLAERKAVLAEVDREWSEAYEQLRDSGKRTALAEITEERMCSGCRMSVPPQTVLEVRRARQIIRCSCGRLLYTKD
jgi:hypothetical protein